MTAIREETTLKLHLATDGIVWFADGDRVPVASGVDIAAFLDDLQAARTVPHVRILGTSQNASLIVATYAHCVKYGGVLELAGPMVCASAVERQEPEIALYRMRQCLAASVLGGWRQAAPADYTTYAMIKQQQIDRDFTPHVAHLLNAHPAWHDLSFVGDADPAASALLLSAIIDPRWFVDPEHPDRGSRLRSFLGLYPEEQENLVKGKVRSSRTIRCRLVLESWKRKDHVYTPAEIEGRPDLFLHREALKAGGGVQGDLRASHKFISYLRHSWLSAIYGTTRWSGRDSLFAPDMLFSTPEEIAAYKQHAALRKCTV